MSLSKCLKRLPLAVVLILCLLVGLGNRLYTTPRQQAGSVTHPTRYLYMGQELEEPRSQVEVDWLGRRKSAQEEQAREYKVFHDFKFSDRLAESGITFKYSVVDDSGRTHKPVHYGHGSGLAVADVDNDGLYDIYFVNQLGCNELWKNLGGGRFENITTRAAVGLCGQISVGASFADVDNDGSQDLFVTTVRHGNHLFHNLGNGNFADITEQAGLNYSGHSSGAVFFDYNRDGLLDLFVSNVGRYTIDQMGRGGFYLGMKDAFFGQMHPDRTEPCLLCERDVKRILRAGGGV
jgi:enediyne biosynthesis protein E4